MTQLPAATRDPCEEWDDCPIKPDDDLDELSRQEHDFWIKLHKLHGKFFHGWVRFRLAGGDNEIALDVVQQSWTLAMRRPACLRKWLLNEIHRRGDLGGTFFLERMKKIARRYHYNDHTYKWFRQPQLVSDPQDRAWLDLEDDDTDRKIMLVKTMMDSLNSKDRALIEARYFEGRSLKEIAGPHMKPTSIGRRISRVLERLRFRFDKS